MDNNNSELESNFNSANTSKEFSLRDAWDFLKANWIWFLLSLIVFLCIGFVYYKVLPRKYHTYSTIYINEEYSRGLNSDVTDLRTNRFFRNTNSVDNEIFILQSRSLMYQVVSELDANIEYFIKAKLRDVQIYSEKAPVSLRTDSLFLPFKLKLDIEENGYKASLERHIGRNKIKKNFRANYGETVSFPGIATFVIDKNQSFDNFTNDYLIISVDTPLASTSKYLSNLSVSNASKMTSIVNISLVDPVSEKAADIVNTLVANYNKDAILSKQETATRTLEFIDDRLNSVGAELSAVDTEVALLKKRNESVNLSSEADLYLRSVAKYQDEATEVEIQILLVDKMRHLLEDFSGEAKLLPANIGIKDADLNASINLYNQSVLQLMRYGGDNSANNPVVRELITEITSQQHAISESMGNIYEALLIQREAINKQINSARSKVVGVPDVEKESLSIIRNQAILSDIYSFLLNRREETGLKKVSTESIARVIDQALPSKSPVSPKGRIVMFAFFVIGVFVPALVMFLRESLRIRIDRMSEVENSVKAPIIGALPSKEDNEDDDKIITSNSRDKISEAFRMVRTNLDLTMPKGGKVISVTSSMSGEGKSFVSINLALSLAITGKKVILLDMDLRKASLAEKISQRRQPTGIVDFLAGKSDDIRQYIERDAMPGVDVVYVGVLPPNPAELLMRDTLALAFDQLRDEYDYIILDVSPVGLVTDALILDKYTDITLYVVRIGYSYKRNIEMINNLYAKRMLKNLTVVVTDSEAGSNYSKNSYYGYGYGYGYGYIQNANQKNSIRQIIKRLKKIKISKK